MSARRTPILAAASSSIGPRRRPVPHQTGRRLDVSGPSVSAGLRRVRSPDTLPPDAAAAVINVDDSIAQAPGVSLTAHATLRSGETTYKAAGSSRLTFWKKKYRTTTNGHDADERADPVAPRPAG